MTPHASRPSLSTAPPSREVGVAHDFKNLLFVITAHCQRLIQTMDPEDARRRDAEAIAVAADRAVTLTRQLLEHDAASTPMPATINLNTLLRDLELLLRGVAGDRVVLRWALAEGVWPLRLHQAQVEQAVVNLVANARDAMPDGGELTIATENRTSADAGGARSWVVLTVSDSGVGMAPEVQAQMFDPYFTTKGADGTGIGLATVQAMVTAAGGHLEVQTAPGHGTAVSVVLPRDAQAIVPSAPPRLRAVERPRSGRPRVLLVDDEPAVRDLLAHCLELEGYEAIVAATGTEALAHIGTPEGALDAVVTDLNLPDVSGAEVIEQSRRKNPAVGVVLISGASAATLAESGGGAPVLMKPFSLADFKRVIRRAVEQRRSA
jgi:two-component system, cell cycle sensor histidine kinase and response regulator CckA